MSPFRVNQLIIEKIQLRVYKIIEATSRDLSVAGLSVGLASSDYKIQNLRSKKTYSVSNSVLRNNFDLHSANYNNIWRKLNV